MNNTYEKALERKELCKEIKEMMIEQMGLDISSDFITNDQPLFGRGLGLDSIDALDVSVGLFDTFGIQVDDDNQEIFSSVNKMADFISAKRAEQADEHEETAEDLVMQ